MHSSGKYTNIAMLGLAFVLLGYASLTLTPVTLKQNAVGMLAAAGVGMSASVQPNQYNTLAEQLSAKEADLNRRAAEMNASGYGSAPGTSGMVPIPADRFGFYSLIMSAALFILVGVNFYYDIQRRKSAGGTPGSFSVDLR